MTLAASNHLKAQKVQNNFHPFFDHITTINGLSGNHVNCIFRDHRGFLWIGTQNGLNEYDGRNITVFKHSRSDNQSIVDNNILSIAEDDSGYLWLGTINGISRFNPYNHKSINYQHDTANPYSLNDNYKCIVYFDKNKTCWIGNESGLSYFNIKTNQFIHLKILPDSLNEKTLTAVGSFLEDKQGGFWLGTYSGLVLYDRKNHKSQRFIFNHKERPRGLNAVTSVFCDHAGRIWAGTWGDGITEFDPVSKTFHSYKWNKNYQFEGTVNIVTSINETQSDDGNYILWVGSTEGLFKINSLPLSDKTVDHILPDASNPHALSSKNISCILSDEKRNLWIGTNNGMNQYTLRNQLFSNTFKFKGSPTKIISDTIKNTVQYYISAWYGNGLTQLDSNLKPVRVWNTIPAKAANPDNRQVSDMVKSKDGTFWIATFNGLYHYDKKTNRTVSYLHKAGDLNSLSDDQATAIAQDQTGNIWIGTYGSGLDRFNPITKKFTHFVHKDTDPTSIINDLIWGIYIDKQQKIWIITDHGFSLYNDSNQHFLNYSGNEKSPNSLRGNGISGMIEDNKGIYWIITDEGLNRFDLQKNQFSFYGTEQGLNDDNIYAITLDKQGLLWMCTPGGVSSFNPITKIFINYDEQNGLPKGIIGPMVTLANGKILAGGGGIILKFNPSEFKIFASIPKIYITQMSVAGSPLPFQKPLTQSGIIVLNYPQNSFTCSVTSPDFFNGSAVKYAYRLTGVDADWIQSGSRNFLSYSNLAAGKYVLHIKAANSDGIWNEKGIELKITVSPPFWKTTWFRISLLLFLALCIYSFFIYRVKSIRKKEALKTAINKQMADMRLKVLRTRINPHFMFNALNSIQECIYTKKTDTASKYLTKFSHLLRLILEQSENTFITVSEEIEILKLYLELESLRFDEGFSYHIKEENIESDIMEIPPMLIQPFVENALWHGLRHKEGEKKLSIHFSADSLNVFVTIEDNGIGREAAKAFRHSSEVKKQSLGMKISEEQLQMIRTLSKQKTGLTIEDLFSETGFPVGTRVILSIPMLEKS
jgi:ligand-binding sensor domain-containing protein